MDNYSIYAEQIKNDIASSKAPSGATIKLITDDNAAKRNEMEKLYARYCADKAGTPIMTRTLAIVEKANNKCANNFFKKIVDTKVGYYASKISYQLDKKRYDEGTVEKLNAEVQDFLTRSNAARLDSTVSKFAGICGYGVKILYIRDGDILTDSVLPYECVFISSNERPQYCLRYYQIVTLDPTGGKITRWHADLYDDSSIYHYEADDAGVYILKSVTPHLFGAMPVIQYPNNYERAPDVDPSVISLIDAYDIVESDAVNDLEQLANAYLVLIGAVLGTTTTERNEKIKELKRAGVLELGAGGDARFITKNINDTFIQNMLKRLEKNIYTFSSSINMNDENFAQNTSGVAMKYKLLALETICQLSENEFKAATLEMFRVLSTLWAKKGININYLDVFVTLKRNFPQDILSEAQASAALRGLVSERTRLSQMSFIDDVEYEIEEMAKDNEPYNLDDEDKTKDKTTDAGLEQGGAPAGGDEEAK